VENWGWIRKGKAQLECVTKGETVQLAWEEHRNNGHFHRDNIKAKILDRITSPNMDQSITKAIMDCGRCKGFGTTHLHSLLEPITRRHPFELMAADTLSMPKGKGGFTKLGLWMDVYAQRVWVTKLKTSATGKSSRKSYSDICDLFTASETLMTDGGPEFDNDELGRECEKRGKKLQICPAYSPWVNGLLEGTNSILLNRLKRMCAPDLGEDEYRTMDLPSNWPDHLEAAVRYINDRILPNLRFSPNELLLGLVINTRPTPMDQAVIAPTMEEVETQMAYVNQQRFDGYAHIVDHAQRRKATFDKQVLSRPPQEVVFKSRDLVQVYYSDLDFTLMSDRKILPKFSAPRRVVSRNQNSYQLETLEGFPIAGKFSSRRLRLFVPRKGMELEVVQAAIEKEWRDREGIEDRVEDAQGEGGSGETVSCIHISRDYSNTFQILLRQIPSRSVLFRHDSVIPFRSTSFILLSPSSVNSVHFRHSIVLMSLLCSELCSFRFMFRIPSAPPYSDLWLLSFLIFPIILLFNNYPYCLLRNYDFIY
jgi:hypothetical protein